MVYKCCDKYGKSEMVGSVDPGGQGRAAVGKGRWHEPSHEGSANVEIIVGKHKLCLESITRHSPKLGGGGPLAAHLNRTCFAHTKGIGRQPLR